MLVRKYFCYVNGTRVLIGLCLLVTSHRSHIRDIWDSQDLTVAQIAIGLWLHIQSSKVERQQIMSLLHTRWQHCHARWRRCVVMERVAANASFLRTCFETRLTRGRSLTTQHWSVNSHTSSSHKRQLHPNNKCYSSTRHWSWTYTHP